MSSRGASTTASNSSHSGQAIIAKRFGHSVAIGMAAAGSLALSIRDPSTCSEAVKPS